MTLQKTTISFLKNRKSNVIDNNREDGDNIEDKKGESNITKKFEAILEKIKNLVKVGKLLNIEIC